jgi:hypothetical protein
MSAHYKVRKHLARGQNYGKWQIKSNVVSIGTIYVDTSETLLLFGCTLKNRCATSQRIYDGESKTVCAWVECTSFMVNDVRNSGWLKLDDADYYDFNPRQHPTWLDSFGVDADDREVAVLVTDYHTLVNGENITTYDVES